MYKTSDNKLKGIKARYGQDGYSIVRNVIDKELIEEASRHVDWLLKKHPGTRPEHVHHTLIPDSPFWVRLVSDYCLLDVAEQFIGPNIALFASHYICKPPHDGQAVLWHQDGSYWPLEPMEVVTCWLATLTAFGWLATLTAFGWLATLTAFGWLATLTAFGWLATLTAFGWLALDASTPENGCMRVIPGTHSLDLQQLQVRHDVPNVLESAINEELVDESQAIDVVLEPGDVSIHHPNLIHGSNPNTSAHWRRGLTIRYIPTTTRVTDESWPCVMLLTGKDKAGLNHYIPFPKYVEGQHMSFKDCENWPHTGDS